MKIFISWSGDRSRRAAVVLRDWLPDVIQTLDPWVSDVDIDSGQRWNRKLQERLDECDFGILCVTRDNPTAPWLLFEAGALAKSVKRARVVPYLLDHESPSEFPSGPLTQFQASRATKSETFDVIRSINDALGEDALPSERLRKAFDPYWPELEERLNDIPDSEVDTGEDARSAEDMLSEVLENTRSISRRLADSQQSAGGGTWGTFRAEGSVEPAGKLSPINRQFVSGPEHDYAYTVSYTLDPQQRPATCSRCDTDVTGEYFNVGVSRSDGKQARLMLCDDCRQWLKDEPVRLAQIV